MGRLKKWVHILLLAAMLAGLYISSSQPYGEQDMRGPIAEIVDESRWQERLQDVKLQYGGRENQRGGAGNGWVY